MRDSYDKAFTITIGLEGKETNDPRDPGGHTQWGLSKKFNPDLDIGNLTIEQAKDIYLKRYWIPSGCDSLPYPIDILTFDRSVLYGVSDARLWASQANSWDDILFGSLQHIVSHWNPTYARGWLNRILILWKMFNKKEDI